MDRARAMGAVLLGLVTITACRPGDVRVDPDPQIGDRARYRYEITATVTRSLDGAEPTTTRIATSLVVDQKVVGVSDQGVEAQVTLRRDGGERRTARVVLDPTGAIRDVDAVAELAGDDTGVSELGALLPPSMVPPSGPLSPGDRWTISVGPITGLGRLARLGIEDGANVAVVHTRIEQTIEESVASGQNVADLAGTLRSTASAAYDLADGSVLRSSTHSTGEVRARIQPPLGLDAQPALGTIDYDINVRATRLSSSFGDS